MSYAYTYGQDTALMELGLSTLTGIEKVAYGIEEARQLLRAVKPYVLSPSALKSDFKYTRYVPGSRFRPAEFVQESRPLPSARLFANRELPNMAGGKGVIKREGSAYDTVKRVYNKHFGTEPPALTPDQHVMLESLLKGHEFDELAGKANQNAFKAQAHNNADVMLREHNRVVTMPPGYEPVKEILQRVRGINGESKVLANYGVNYGETERLSRGARNRIGQRMEADATAANEAALQRTRDMFARSKWIRPQR